MGKSKFIKRVVLEVIRAKAKAAGTDEKAITVRLYQSDFTALSGYAAGVDIDDVAPAVFDLQAETGGEVRLVNLSPQFDEEKEAQWVGLDEDTGKEKYEHPRFYEVIVDRNATRPISIFFEEFDRERAILRFAGKEILLSKKVGIENNPVRLLGTLTKDPKRYWYQDEILDEWEGAGVENRRIPKNRVYNAAYDLNEAVAMNTSVGDFIEFTTQKFRINPKYLR